MEFSCANFEKHQFLHLFAMLFIAVSIITISFFTLKINDSYVQKNELPLYSWKYLMQIRIPY